jgi:hypothetical protein
MKQKTSATITSFFLIAPFLIALVSIVFILPPFWMGVWYQAEPVAIALHASSFLCSIAMASFSFRNPKIIAALILSPASLCLLAFVLLSLGLSLFAKFPYLSFLGNPMIGQGAIYYVDFYIFFISALFLIKIPFFRKIIYWVVLIQFLIIIGIHYTVPHASNWKLYTFSDYIIFYGLFTAMVLFFMGKIKFFKYLLLISIMIVAVFLSKNKTIAVLIIGAVPLYFILHWLVKKSVNWLHYIPLFAIFGVISTLYIYGYFNENFLNITTAHTSLLLRNIINISIISHMFMHPFALIFGEGWGHFGELFFSEFPLGLVGSTLSSMWGELHRVALHSHNLFLETFQATGMFGLLLLLLFILNIGRYSYKRSLYVYSCMMFITVGLGTMWFMVSTTMPLMALALGINMKPSAYSCNSKKIFVFSCIVILLFSMISLAGAVFSYVVASKTNIYKSSNMTRNYFDRRLGGIHYGYSLKSCIRELSYNSSKAEVYLLGTERARLTRCLSLLDISKFNKSGLMVQADDLLLRNQVSKFALLPYFRKYSNEWLNDWSERVWIFIKIATKRTEVIAPYLQYLLNLDRGQEIIALCDYILAYNPQDPVALWYSGQVFVMQSIDVENGKNRIKKALNLGVSVILN